jgi:hypothetical protein
MPQEGPTGTPAGLNASRETYSLDQLERNCSLLLWDTNASRMTSSTRLSRTNWLVAGRY